MCQYGEGRSLALRVHVLSVTFLILRRFFQHLGPLTSVCSFFSSLHRAVSSLMSQLSLVPSLPGLFEPGIGVEVWRHDRSWRCVSCAQRVTFLTLSSFRR